MLYHTNFKLNFVNFPEILPPAPPLNPLRGSQCSQIPSSILFPNSIKSRFFPFWLTPWYGKQPFKRVAYYPNKIWKNEIKTYNKKLFPTYPTCVFICTTRDKVKILRHINTVKSTDITMLQCF